MSRKDSGGGGWRAFFGISPNRRLDVVQILQQQYVEAVERMNHLSSHALRMPYAQFREKLLSIAAEERKISEELAQRIRLMGAIVPTVSSSEAAGTNGWQTLLAELQEQQRSAAKLWERLPRIQSEFPEIADFLRRVYEAGGRHRSELTDMLMRSDPPLS